MTSSYKVTTILSEHTIEGVHGINHDSHLIFFNEQGKVFAGFASDVWERFEKVEDTDTEVQPTTNTQDAPVQPGRLALAAGERDLLGPWFESGDDLAQADLDYFDAGTVVVDGDGDQWVKNNDGTWSIGWSEGDYVNWDSEKMFDPDESVTPFKFANYPEPVEAEAQPTNETGIKVGDRVRIVDSNYTSHPSRMKGGSGTVVRVYDGLVGVDVDNSEVGYGNFPWSFPNHSVEVITSIPVGTELTYEQFKQAPTGTKAQGRHSQLVYTKTDAGGRITHYSPTEPRPEDYQHDKDLEWEGRGRTFTVIA